jgi:hypothetical protein
MKHKALRGLLVVLSLIIMFTAGGGSQRDGFNLLVQQISIIGPRHWLGLMAGSIVASAPVIAPLTERIARSLPRIAGPAADIRIGVIYAG